MSTELATTETTTPAPQQPSTNTGRPLTKSGVVHQTTDDLWRTAQMLVKTGMVPKSYSGKAELAYAAIITGMELGYSPAAALRCIAVVNGMPSVWGTGGYALPMNHELYDGHDVTYQMPGEPESDIEPELPTELDKIPNEFRVICRVYRKGQRKPTIAKFSVADAKRAKLWGMTAQSGAGMPWCYYPARMMMHKAVGNALEAAFPEAYFNIGKDLDQEYIPQEDKPTTITNGTTYLKPPKTKPTPAPKQEEPEKSRVSSVPMTDPEPAPQEEAIDVTPEPKEPAPEKSRVSSVPTTDPDDKPKKAKAPAVNTKAIMADFAIYYPDHDQARLTKGANDKLTVKCDCGSEWDVKDTAGIITFPVVKAEPHVKQADEKAPSPSSPPAKKEKLGADPGEDEERAQIEALPPEELSQFFEEKLKQLAKANISERRKGCRPIFAMIRARLQAATTLIHISQVLQWTSRANFIISLDGESCTKLKAEVEAAQAKIKASK